MKKPIITINEEYIQNEASGIIERRVSDNEYEEIIEEINTKLFMLVGESISKVMGFNELLERNKYADKALPHYKVYWMNKDTYQQEFKTIKIFRNKEDAVQFIHHDFIGQLDQWKVVQVDKNNKQKEVYKINC